MKPSELIEYLNYLFDQVALQQEIRDRWFRYYMTVAGAAFLVGLTAIQFFIDRGFDLSLYIFLLILSITVFLVGFCFFMIYLRQRGNYLRFYRVMENAEKKLLKNEYGKIYKVARIHKYGADFFTVWIHILVNSLFIAIAFVLIVIIANNGDISSIRLSYLLFTLIIYLLSIFFLEIIRRKNFE
jgi:hypothetical protein